MRLFKALRIIILLLIGLSVSSTFAEEKTWKSKMGELLNALSETVPYLYPGPNQDNKAFTEKVKKIYGITKQLDSHLNHSVNFPDSDPALPYIAGLFREDIERAYGGVQGGHTDYAKGIIRSSVAYCIACHTRTKSGVEFPLISAFDQPLKQAAWIDKIEFQTATRQFDPVMGEVMSQLKNPRPASMGSIDIERGVRIALAIAVRVKKDPDSAAFLAEAIRHSPIATDAMKEIATAWLKDIRQWQSEKGRRYSSDKDLLLGARKLIGSPDSSGMMMADDESGVRYLRASVLMHDLLREYPKSEYTAEALYIVGLSYESLRELGLWSLHEMYFLACINRSPHTILSEQCYDRYQDSITFGYTGSAGTNMPAAVRKHLDNIKKLASRIDKK